MLFIFNGTLDEFKDVIYIKAKEHQEDIVVYQRESDKLEIGFMRLGHYGGRFFVANMTERNGVLILDGKIEDIFPDQSKNKLLRLIGEIDGWLLIYVLFEIIPLLVWLLIFHSRHLWIPLILPIPIITILPIIRKKEGRELDAKFINFMSSFTTFEAAHDNFQSSWNDVYRKLDLARGKLVSISDDSEDMLLITYDDGMQIDVGYISDDNTYCITVVASDKIEDWNAPLGVFTVKDKSKLAPELQKAIYKFRNR